MLHRVCTNRKAGPLMSRFNSPGFTLIEVLLAVFITSVVLSTIYVSYTGSLRVIKSTGKQTEIYQKARIAMDRIIEDLESIYVAVPESADTESVVDFLLAGEKRELSGRRADTLRFISRSHISFTDEKSGHGKTAIIYDVVERSEDGPLVLTRSDRPALLVYPEENSENYVLCEGLESVIFSYGDKDGEIYDVWDPTGFELSDKPLADRIPAMVSINLSFRNEQSPEQPMTFTTSVILPAGVK